MNGNKILLDSNIIVYLLAGDKTVADLLHEKTTYISFISELGLLGYSDLTNQEYEEINRFLKQCFIVDVNPEIKSQSIAIRKKYKIKLPDSIVVATSLFLDIPIISSDKRLSKIDGINFILYQRS